MSNTISYCNVGVACFCPCYLLGVLKTKLSHENSFHLCGCINLPIGWNGMYECMKTFGCTVLGWPLSPCLSLYILEMRKKISTIYNEDSELPRLTYSLRNIICWPCILEAQYIYLKKKEMQGMLTFDWDLELHRDHMNKSAANYTTKTIMIIGPDFDGKFFLIRKLLALLQINQNSFHVPISNMNDESEEFNKIKIGVTRLTKHDGLIKFLEVWSIPSNEINSNVIKKYLPTASLCLFSFCEGDDESFREMQNLFYESKNYLPKKKLICSIKMHQDHVNNSQSFDNSMKWSEQMDGLNSTIRPSSIQSGHQFQKTDLEALLHDNLVETWCDEQNCKLLHAIYENEENFRKIRKQILHMIT